VSGWWLIHREAEKAPLLSFQKLIEAENASLTTQTFFFFNSVCGSTAEKKFYGRSLPAPRDRKKERRVVRYPHFLAEEISKVSILVREVAREIRAGAVCLWVHLFWFTFLVPLPDCFESTLFFL